MTLKYFKVGGTVRDEKMGKTPKDLDLLVIANSFEEAIEDFRSSDGTIFVEKPEFVTFRGKHPQWGIVDVRLARVDGIYKDARHPESVTLTKDIKNDLSTRDFTINAMAKDMDTGEIIDPFDGRVDLENGFIQCVGDTEQRMREDIIRLLRAFKFASRFGFRVSWNIQEAARNKEIVELLNKVPIERIWNEIEESFRNNTLFMLDVMRDFPYVRDVIFNRNIILAPKIVKK